MRWVEGYSVVDVYVDMLADTLKNRSDPFNQVAHVKMPVKDGEVFAGPLSLTSLLRQFEFDDGRTGKWWERDRMEALFKPGGEYYAAIRKNAQFNYVGMTLKAMIEEGSPRWNANRLIVTLFDPTRDLHLSRAPTPPCMVNISFHPVRDTLGMTVTFRAQYTDAKGYGNLLSLAFFLLAVCKHTGFKPGSLYSIAHKTILRYSRKEATRFLDALEGAS